MNIVAFNKTCRAWADMFSRKFRQAEILESDEVEIEVIRFYRKRFKECMEYPPFLIEDALPNELCHRISDEGSKIFSHDCEWPRLPFPVLRFCMDDGSGLGFFMWRIDDRKMNVFFFQHSRGKPGIAPDGFQPNIGFGCDVVFDEEQSFSSSVFQIDRNNGRFYRYEEICEMYEEVGMAVGKSGREMVDEMIAYGMGYTIYFALMIEDPSLRQVEVLPRQAPRKSVEWRKSRTHFLWMDPDHASTTQKRSGKSSEYRRNTPEKEGKLIRAAHWRKGHWRHYRHPRYRRSINFNLTGKRFWIKKRWLGPEEWEGTDRKIYRLVTPESEPSTVESNVGL